VVLPGEVGAHDDSEEGEALAIEVDLLLVMSLEVLQRGVHLEHRVAVIPGQLLHAVLVHLILNADLLLVGEFAVLESGALILNATLAGVDLTNDQNFYLFLLAQGVLENLFGGVNFSTKQTDDLVATEVGVNEHNHLDLEGEVNTVGLVLERRVVLALHQLV
jgi:hypothetical protein